MELFRKTLIHFFNWLSKKKPEYLTKLRPKTLELYDNMKEDGWFGKVDKNKVKQLLSVLAERLYEVIMIFGQDKEVKIVEPYQLVERLFNEHCKLVTSDNNDNGDDKNNKNSDSSDNENGDKPTKIKVLKKPEKPGSSLQSPYDPDAGCSYKGPGYFVHVTMKGQKL